MARTRPSAPTFPRTISIAFVRGLLSGLHARGQALDPWLRRAGIAPALLDRPAGRVTVDQFIALSRALVRGLGDEGSGLFSRPLGRGSLALIARSALGAATVADALRRMTRAFNLLQDDVRASVVLRGELTGVRFAVPSAFHPERLYVHETMLRVTLRFGAWLHGGRLRAHAFDFAIPRPPHADEYPKLLPGPVRFDQERTTLWFPTSALTQAVRRDEGALRAFLAKMPEGLIDSHFGDRTASTRVRDCLARSTPRWLDLPSVADELSMAASTLQRHLAAEGSSFQAVKDQLRRDLAIVRLITSEVSVAALSTELGFSDQPTFQRAFKTWTGSAPGVYRRSGLVG